MLLDRILLTPQLFARVVLLDHSHLHHLRLVVRFVFQDHLQHLRDRLGAWHASLAHTAPLRVFQQLQVTALLANIQLLLRLFVQAVQEIPIHRQLVRQVVNPAQLGFKVASVQQDVRLI